MKNKILVIGSAAHMGIGSMHEAIVERMHKEIGMKPIVLPIEEIHSDIETGGLEPIISAASKLGKTEMTLKKWKMDDNYDQYFNPKFTNRSERRKQEKQQRKNNKRK